MVVIFCTKKPGQSSSESGPVEQYLASSRCSSNVIAATSGRNGSLSKKNSTLSPSLPKPSCGKNGPSALNTKIDTSATITMNVVPQRGCSVVRLRALSTVSSTPDS